MIAMLPWLAVAFGGIAGNGNAEAPRISAQILSAIADAGDVEPIRLPPKELATIAHHASGAREAVARLGVDGLIAGELVGKGRALALRIVIYGPDGGMRSLNETSLTDRVLAPDDLQMIRDNLAEEIRALAPKHAAAMHVPAQAPTIAPAPSEVAEAAAAPEATGGDPADTESPVGEPADHATTEPTAETSAEASADDEDPRLGLRVGVGLGIVSRSFTPGPATVAGYSASPVGAVSFAAQIQPARRLCLDALVDRTLSMSTPMGNDTATTTMSRWEVSADYTLVRGGFAVATRFGLGRRAFSIDSIVAGRTPDSEYNYLIAGATASAMLGQRVVVRGLVAFEPVLWGTEPTEMAFGEARRWAIDVGASLEVRVRDHVYARLAADLQRFAWIWTAAGERGSGGAVDLFPSVMASLGAAY